MSWRMTFSSRLPPSLRPLRNRVGVESTPSARPSAAFLLTSASVCLLSTQRESWTASRLADGAQAESLPLKFSRVISCWLA